MKLITTLLIASSAASAFVGGCDGTFAGEVQALYWRASSCPIPFARSLVNTDVSLRDDHLIYSDHDWGFRVGVGYGRNCSFLGLSYLYLQTTDGARVNRPMDGFLQIQGNEESVDFARSDLKFRYQNVDFKAHQLLHCGCCSTLSVLALARWVDIDMKYRVAGTATVGSTVSPRSLSQGATFDGGGLGVGFAASFGLPCDLEIGGSFDFAAIIGKSKIARFTALNNTLLTVRPGNGATTFVPAGTFDLFLGYSRCFCQTDWSVRLGYEMHYYWSALRYSTVDEDEDGIPILGCYGVGFGGPYIGLSARF